MVQSPLLISRSDYMWRRCSGLPALLTDSNTVRRSLQPLRETLSDAGLQITLPIRPSR